MQNFSSAQKHRPQVDMKKESRTQPVKAAAKVLCFGSLNIDYTYSVPRFVERGETVPSTRLDTFTGGKGLNQSIALARAMEISSSADIADCESAAGSAHSVSIAGMIGEEGIFLKDAMDAAGVDTSLMRVLSDIRTGHAIIQNNAEGDNCIIIFGGANREITPSYADEVLSHFSAGDVIVMQNEISSVSNIMKAAAAKGMKIVMNPSPIDDEVFRLPLELTDLMILNEIEAGALLGKQVDVRDAIKDAEALAEKYSCKAVITLGPYGAACSDGRESFSVGGIKINTIDTTGAGDTFTGYLVAEMISGKNLREAVNTAIYASALECTRKGAAPSIPTMSEVKEFMGISR